MCTLRHGKISTYRAAVAFASSLVLQVAGGIVLAVVVLIIVAKSDYRGDPGSIASVVIVVPEYRGFRTGE